MPHCGTGWEPGPKVVIFAPLFGFNMMSKRYDLIVFDWDGTVMDSTAVIVGSIQAACRGLVWRHRMMRRRAR